ncbi:MAG TPA: UTRA domain-containing protein [Rhodobacteraceae bacterium]|nr:UTRA domain-containing protein [Paracoccaceae bacterium]
MAGKSHSENAPPLYKMVKRHIIKGINSGKYPPGSKLPSENQLVQVLAVSRMTVNRALRELTRDGVIFRMQGAGSFVSLDGPDNALSELRDIQDIVAQRGGIYSCSVQSAGFQALDPADAELFALPSGHKVLALELLHFEDGRPLQYERRLVREEFAPELLSLDFSRQSLHAYLQSIAPASEVEHVVEAGLADTAACRYLKLEPADPVLRIRRRTWVGQRVVTVGYFSHPGVRFRVSVRFSPPEREV